MTQINPYNFVPLGNGQVPYACYRKRHRFHKDCYSGILVCSLKVLSPLVTLDHRNFCIHHVFNQENEKKEIKVFNFLRNSKNIPILQGSSLKGMIRSIYEAMTDSCLTLATTEGESKSQTVNVPYKYEELKKNCTDINSLCPSCRIFGTIEGDFVCQGKVRISDAELATGNLTQNRLFLKELSNPKPHHCAIYGKEKSFGKPIAGRKFYYHHKLKPNFSLEDPPSYKNRRSIGVEENAPPQSEFKFEISVDDLHKEEFGLLLLAIELTEGLRHKIGVGKAIGLGSCSLAIDRARSIVESVDRYRSFDSSANEDWYSLKADRSKLPESLIEILRLNKFEDGEIGYPSGNNYPSEPIDALGVFGGHAKKGGRPPWPEEIFTEEPTDLPPTVKQDEEAAWLKEIYKEKLVFVNEQKEERVRKRSGYQGKTNLLVVGEWFILSGTNTSKRAL